MPIRTASLSKQIHKNGARLHQAMLARIHSLGADHAASEAETALQEERRLLKEAKVKRQEMAAQPKPKAARIVREAKPKAAKTPKAPKAAKEAKATAKASKDHMTRTEKHAQKAAALEAAKKASKKSSGKH